MRPSTGPRPRALWCSAHYWQSAVQVSAHQHVRQLARRGWDVLFLSTPVTPFHAAAVPRSADHRARFRAWHARGRPDGAEPGVTSYTPLTLAPLSSVIGLRYDWVLRHWQDLTVPRLSRDLARLGFDAPDLLVVDSPLYAYLLPALRPRRGAYRMTDFNPGFASATPHLAALERETAAAADVVLYTAQELEPHVVELGARRRALVANGVDVQRFGTPAAAPPEYDAIAGPRAVYVGSLREWFDYALLGQAAAALPEVSFVVIGPERWARRRLPALPNVHVLGERPHDELPGYLQHADVGLIPFDRASAPEMVDAINPLKLYEYAAAGLPIVCTDWRAVRRLASPALLASDGPGFVAQLRAALRERDALGAAGRTWVGQHAWQARTAELLDAVDLG